MKNAIWILIVLFFLISCKTVDKNLKDRVIGSDSIAVIFFKGDGSMDTVVKVKIIRDIKKIEQITELIAADKITKKINCGYDGSLHYFKQNRVIQNIYFRMYSRECMQFTYTLDGAETATKLTSEAIKVIENLKED